MKFSWKTPTKIVGIEGVTPQQIASEVQQGARFVLYHYCISVILLTFRRSSNIYFVRARENTISRGLGFSLISLLLGWWGIPWGPIYTVGSLITNFNGGKDVTQAVLASFRQQGV
jgi:hypothetical protein